MKMNKTLLLMAAAILFTKISVASTAVSTDTATVLDNFEDATLSGWYKGPRSKEPLVIATEANGNHYLEVESYGPRSGRHPDSDSKLIVNASDQWTGGIFNGMKTLFADMINLGTEDIPMNIAFTSKDGFTAYLSMATKAEPFLAKIIEPLFRVKLVIQFCF